MGGTRASERKSVKRVTAKSKKRVLDKDIPIITPLRNRYSSAEECWDQSKKHVDEFSSKCRDMRRYHGDDHGVGGECSKFDDYIQSVSSKRYRKKMLGEKYYDITIRQGYVRQGRNKQTHTWGVHGNVGRVNISLDLDLSKALSNSQIKKLGYLNIQRVGELSILSRDIPIDWNSSVKWPSIFDYGIRRNLTVRQFTEKIEMLDTCIKIRREFMRECYKSCSNEISGDDIHYRFLLILYILKGKLIRTIQDVHGDKFKELIR